jgi:hypothetical protein
MHLIRMYASRLDRVPHYRMVVTDTYSVFPDEPEKEQYVIEG